MSNPIHITIEEQELIDNYLNNRLTSAETEKFNKLLQDNESWNQKLAQVQLLSVGIAETGLREKLDEFHGGIQSYKKKAVVKKMPGTVKWIAAAAVLGLVILAGKLLFFNQTSNEKLFAGFYKQDPGLATEMGVSENYNFDRAMVDYKTGAYKNAVAEWNKLAVIHPHNDTLHYFIANALMGDKQWQTAIESFNKVIAQPSSAFKSDAYWYKGMALLQLNKTAEAIVSIEASDHPQKNTLISKLKK